MAGWVWRILGAGALATAGVLTFAAIVPAATNLLANGGFEGSSGVGSLSAWGASGGSLSLVAGNGGGHAARVTAQGGAQAYAYTTSKPVTNATAGAAYTLDGTVRSGTGGTVCLKLKEVPAGGSSTVGSAQQCIAATSAWQAFPTVSYTVAKAGDSLTVNVVESAPASGATFDIDNLVLAAGSSGGGGDTSAPTVPGNVHASADSSTAVTVTWSASSDNVGVAGYDVFRDGTRVQTVGGSTTTFHDSGLSPSTTYTYTVDAFDAAGNTSNRSAGSSITTPSGGGGGGGPCGTAAPSTAPYSHIVVIMDENLTVSAWQAASDATYTHMLSTNCRYETNAAGETHPSFPNYLAVASGTFNTCLACSSNADNIFHQLGAAGLTWRDYNQSMPSNCAGNTSSVPYYRDGHNPAYWFTDLGPTSKGGDGSCAKYDVPADPNLWNDIAADSLPSFAWIAPDDCRDMHWMTGTCDTVTGQSKTQRIAIGDAYIQRIVTAIAATPSYRAGQTLVVVTWDESNEQSVQTKGNWGIDCSDPSVYAAKKSTCQVVTILVSARITPGPTSTFYSHYSLTAAFENNFALPLLGGARNSWVTPAPIY